MNEFSKFLSRKKFSCSLAVPKEEARKPALMMIESEAEESSWESVDSIG